MTSLATRQMTFKPTTWDMSQAADNMAAQTYPVPGWSEDW